MTNPDVPVSPRAQPNAGPKLLVGIIVLVALCAIGVFGFRRLTDAGVAGKEIDQQKAEIEECKKNLAEFQVAWTHYKKDHNGRDPGKPEDLVPKYISDPDKLVCPTAKRWIGMGKNMSQGTILIAGKQHPTTYEFRVFSASYPIQVRQTGDRTILIACDSHREGVYRAVYHRGPQLNTFDPDQRAGLNEAVRDTKTIVLRKNGTVDLQAEDQ
ncbi:MAG TPA: hypothetical protein VKT77_20575 [Chthonomonadaceae bacterium]|nr:hypothetical protein [Chthonomonadaceae bacterium]